MLSDNDSFDDDDDFDLDKVYDNAQATQRLQQSQFQQPTRTPEPVPGQKRPLNGSTTTEDIYQVKGENAILRGQIEKLQKEQLDAQKRLKDDFEKLLKEKAASIDALQETITNMKSQHEFLVSENKNLYQANSRKRKLRTSEHKAIEAQSEQAETTSTQNTSNVSDSTMNFSVNDQTSMLTSIEAAQPEIKVVVTNQATFFQDEKTLFLEAITNYVIPGMPHTTLHYLENISSSFEFSSIGFTIKEDLESFKSSILKFLINFQNKNRVDYLLTTFITVLMDYLDETFKVDNTTDHRNIQLLSIPFLLSLINFALNYRPKAISDAFIGQTTKKVIKFIKQFQVIYKPEFDYLALPDSNHILKYAIMQNKNDETVDYSFIEKPMHVKILEVFTSLFLTDTLTTLSKIASFHVFSFDGSAANTIFWKQIPGMFLANSFLSTKSPIPFIYNTLEILINSITGANQFAYDNVKNMEMIVQEISPQTHMLLEQCIKCLTHITPSQIHYNVYGLNKHIGSNRHLKLLDMISIRSDKLASTPTTNSFDSYDEVLMVKPEDFIKQEFYILSTKMKVLELFEMFYSILIMLTIPDKLTATLLNSLSQVIGEEQEIIIRNPRSSNNKLRIDLISKAVTLIHKLVVTDTFLDGGKHKINLREMIIVLLRISAKSMKNESINYVEQLRTSGYNGTLFNGVEEMKELDKFGIWNYVLSFDKLSIEDKKKTTENRIQIEIDLYNGIEFNYSDETIDLARDIVGASLTGDEADNLHEGINYLDDDDFTNLNDD